MNSEPHSGRESIKKQHPLLNHSGCPCCVIGGQSFEQPLFMLAEWDEVRHNRRKPIPALIFQPETTYV
ncbi:hypothetical protein [Gimesia aquarii]|uniref:hypothetical protein n=1 Tax=Gimesia aquarii TaxID=2527964 RepID=UPI0011AA97F1|nr:hypothetical protein [Gimesia aquarii]